MSLICPIIGLILVIAGFAIRREARKERKENNNLRYGLIRDVEETDDGYNVEVEYLDDTAQAHRCTLEMNKKPRGDRLILEITGPIISVYDERTSMIIMPTVLWILGAFFCFVWTLL